MNFSLLSAEPGERSVATYLSEPLIIVAIIVIIIGLALMLLAKTLTYRRDKTVDSSTYKQTETYKITIIVGGIITFVGLIVMIIRTLTLVLNY
ncbi:MAG: hypothetical protein IJ837_01890 [Clostridia bacterium]|nr:hypothetical protein [Clostridia bacterium]